MLVYPTRPIWRNLCACLAILVADAVCHSSRDELGIVALAAEGHEALVSDVMSLVKGDSIRFVDTGPKHAN